MSGTKK